MDDDSAQSRSVGQGYPEEQPAGANPAGRDGAKQGPEAEHIGPPKPAGPKSSDSSPSRATGNPRAAGG